MSSILLSHAPTIHALLIDLTHSLPMNVPTLFYLPCQRGVAIHWPSHGCPIVLIIVGVQVELGRQGLSLPTVQCVGVGAGVGVAMH